MARQIHPYKPSRAEEDAYILPVPNAIAAVRMRARRGGGASVTFDPPITFRARQTKNGCTKGIHQHAEGSDVHRVQSVREIERFTGDRKQI